jgi:hypothetical protein
MRVTSLMAALCVLLLARPMMAQDWKEYENRADRFTVPAPGEPHWTFRYVAGNTFHWGLPHLGAATLGRLRRPVLLAYLPLAA